METYTPFCGTPPVPSELLTRWTLDPLLLGGLALAALLLWRGTQGKARGRAVTGWALAALLFVSPLCALSMALFSARVAQHLLLVLVAAPLLAPAVSVAVSVAVSGRVPLTAVTGVFAALFWVWHLPGPYALTLRGDLAYWAMHLSLLGAATLFWAALRDALADRPFATALCLGFAAAQMTGLAALLVLSGTAWHRWHDLVTAPYGMTALGDQALAGALMWVGGGFLVSAAASVMALRLMRGYATGATP